MWNACRWSWHLPDEHEDWLGRWPVGLAALPNRALELFALRAELRAPPGVLPSLMGCGREAPCAPAAVLGRPHCITSDAAMPPSTIDCRTHKLKECPQQGSRHRSDARLSLAGPLPAGFHTGTGSEVAPTLVVRCSVRSTSRRVLSWRGPCVVFVVVVVLALYYGAPKPYDNSHLLAILGSHTRELEYTSICTLEPYAIGQLD